MIWTISYWLLLTAAIAAAIYALFWNRPGWRGRPKLRCRKCFYDLTATPGDQAEAPIQCPECGKKHPSSRSMRKTKRSKKWIAIACTFWLAAYAAQVTPKVQKNGWDQLVPRLVIVASLPFLSEEQGSGLHSLSFFGGPTNFGPQGFDKWITDQVGSSRAFWLGNQPTEYGWITKRVAFMLARLESESVITDGTTAKGNAYKSVLSKIVHADEAYAFEENWAKGVATVEAKVDTPVAPTQMIYGQVRVRRLLQESYELTGGQSSNVYRVDVPNSMWINGYIPSGTPDELRAYWIDHFLWDRIRPKEPTYTYYERTTPFPLGVDDGSGEINVSFMMRDLNAVQQNGNHRPSYWMTETQVPYEIDQSLSITEDSTAETKDWIESHLLAKITANYDRNRDKWVPIIELKLYNPRSTDPLESILFGGQISVEVVWSLSGTEYSDTVLRSKADTWWKWSVEQNEQSEVDSPLNQFAIGKPRPVRTLTARSSQLQFAPGEIFTAGSTPAEYKGSSYRVVIRIKPTRSSSYNFSGLWAEKFYTGEIEIPLNKWSTDDLKHYIVNGVLPDHAMP